MSGLSELQQALPKWVTLERPSGRPEITEKQVGNLSVVEVYAFPEASADAPHTDFGGAPPDQVRANVHFVEVAPTANFPDAQELVETVRGAFGEGEWQAMRGEDLTGGPSYMALGGWLGSQDLALMLIGAVELAGIAKAITPALLGMEGQIADQMAGNGLVMLGPWGHWGDDGWDPEWVDGA